MPWAIAAAAITAGTTLYATSQNSKAAKDMKAGELEGARIENEAIDKQIAAIRQGIGEGDQLYSTLRDATQPGVDYVRDVIGGSNALTPEQVAERDQLRRRVENSVVGVGGSALRGSGRSFVDAMKTVDTDFTNRALTSNRDRSDRAALSFLTPNFNASGQQAQAHATMGREVGNAIAGQGANLASATTSGARDEAEARLANTGLITSGIGDIASGIQSWQKDQSRPAKYTAPTSADADPYGLNR